MNHDSLIIKKSSIFKISRVIFLIFQATFIMIKTPVSAQILPAQRLRDAIDGFVKGYKNLNIEELGVDYKTNLMHISPVDTLNMRLFFFERYQKLTLAFSHYTLDSNDRLQLQHLQYQINFELRRVRLEKKFKGEDPKDNILNGGLSKLRDGKEWYGLYVDKYVSKQISADSLLAMGKAQVKFVQAQIQRIQNRLGYKGQNEAFYKMLNDSSFVLTDSAKVEHKYAEIQAIVLKHLGSQFADVNITAVKILPSPQSGPQTPPAYFDKGVFYFNFYRSRHNIRNMDYLYLHEGIPGHHYDAEEFEKRKQFPLEQLFSYSYNGCFEGWAAYCEYLGKDLGLYNSAYAEAGRWQWDLVRSARVVIDVGIHYRGWTKKKALAYWHETIPGQDDIAEREVTRCMNWPCQVLSYKAGELAILKLKTYAQKLQGRSFDIKRFHTLILKHLKLPLQVMERSVIVSINNTKMVR